VDSLECYEKIRKVLADFEKARKSERRISVTELAKKIASPRSHGGSWQKGFSVHEKVWGDPLDVCMHEEYWTPLPLAYKFGDTWIYGVADYVHFINGIPVDVVELKYFNDADKYSKVQVAIYGWLVFKNFNVKPIVWLVLGWNGRRFKNRIKVEEEVEILIKNTLERLSNLIE